MWCESPRLVLERTTLSSRKKKPNLGRTEPLVQTLLYGAPTQNPERPPKPTHSTGTDSGGINTAVLAADDDHNTTGMGKIFIDVLCLVEDTPDDTVVTRCKVAENVGPKTSDTLSVGTGILGMANEHGTTEPVNNSGPNDAYVKETSENCSENTFAPAENDVNRVVSGEVHVGSGYGV